MNTKAAERKRIYELSSPQSSGKTKRKVNFTPVRKISKASKLNSKSFEKINYFEVDLDSNKATCSSEFKEAIFAAFQHVNITLYYYLENQRIETIEILIREDNVIRDFIQAAIEQINAKLKEEKKCYCFNPTLSEYSIKIVKKNGMPKHDIPSFHHNTTIHNCHESKLALTWNSDATSNLIQCPAVHIENTKGNNKQKYSKKDVKNPQIKKYKYEKEIKESDDCIIV